MAHKLTMLRTYAGPELFAVLKSATTFEEALGILDKQFRKQARILFARHQALIYRQKEGEDVSCVNRVQILGEKCECKELNVQQHKDTRRLRKGLRKSI